MNELRKGARGWEPEGLGEGWPKGGGPRGVGLGGWNLYLNEVLYKTDIVSSDSGVVTHVTTRNTRNRGESPILGESPL